MEEQPGTKLSRFVWHDMMTTDVRESMRFHEAVFGWTVEETPTESGRPYSMILADGRGIGGFVELNRAHRVPSHWIGYVTVADVDAVVERARDLGGKAPVAGTDIPNVGRFAVLSHPGGSFVSPFAPRKLEEAVPEAETIPGRFCWNQLMTRAPEPAAEFYGRVFDWETEVTDVDGSRYWLFRRDGVDSAGMMPMPDTQKFPDFWLAYVEVRDVDAAVAKAAEKGGQVVVPPSDIPGLARVAVLADPTGALLGISAHFR
jgi:hypothetical protein